MSSAVHSGPVPSQQLANFVVGTRNALSFFTSTPARRYRNFGAAGLAIGVLLASGLRAAMNAFGVELPTNELVLEPRTFFVGIVLGFVVLPKGIEVLIVSDPSNMHWLTGYDGCRTAATRPTEPKETPNEQELFLLQPELRQPQLRAARRLLTRHRRGPRRDRAMWTSPFFA